MALLALARYLTTAQLCALGFPGRQRRTAEKVLEALAGMGPSGKTPLLRRVVFQRYHGEGVLAWTVTAAGHKVARELLGALREPAEDIGHEFLEHTVQLNELFVALFQPASALPSERRVRGGRGIARDYARADARRVRWTSSDGARLPWREHDLKRGVSRERVIQPDAVLELPQAKRRLFLECEMGTHTVVPTSPDKDGATLAKAARYESYLNRVASPGQGERKSTFYAVQYPDGFEPEVLFLVLTDGRARLVNEALAAWQRREGRALPVRALTFPQAAEELLGAIGKPMPQVAEGRGQGAGQPLGGPPSGGLPADEALLLKQSFSEALRGIQSARHQVRALPTETRAALKLTEPAYPAEMKAAQVLLARLVTTGGGAP